MANYKWPKSVDNIWNDFTTLSHPSKIVCFGATVSGKTHWAKEVIKRRDELFFPHIDHVYIIYGSHNSDQYRDLWLDPNITLSSGDPDELIEDIYTADGNKLLFVTR